MRNPRNILQHEFIGLRCRIMRSRNSSQVGLEGRIIDETLKTVVLETSEERKRVAKSGATFRLWLKGATVEIDGDVIIARPEDRIKKQVRRW